jgi:hypothetical protein
MKSFRFAFFQRAVLPFAALVLSACAISPSDHAGHAGHAAVAEQRMLVKFPDAMRAHMLSNMRDHLAALTEIQAHLAKGAFDAASDTAEERLGMTSLKLHGAHDAARFMPEGMQAAGTAMHRSASQFARAAKDASVTGDIKAPLAALAVVSQTCVACHTAYRVH